VAQHVDRGCLHDGPCKARCSAGRSGGGIAMLHGRRPHGGASAVIGIARFRAMHSGWKTLDKILKEVVVGNHHLLHFLPPFCVILRICLAPDPLKSDIW